MSKGSLFWGKGSGKLGEAVLYRAGGEQRTRTYVAKIKNPKTLAQMENRLSMRNFAQVFRALKPILSKSFPNRTAKESGFNAFVKANKSVNSAVVTREGALQGLSVPYDMQLSQGYLTQFGECKRIETDANSFQAGFDLSSHPNVDAISALIPDVDSLDEFPSTNEQYKALWDALQIPVNGKITIVVAEYADEGYTLRYVSAGREDAVAMITNSPFRMSCKMMETPSGEKPILRVSDGGAEVIATCIISWVDGSGKLQVTNSRMAIPAANQSYGTSFVKGGDVYAQVLEQYGYTQDSAL